MRRRARPPATLQLAVVLATAILAAAGCGGSDTAEGPKVAKPGKSAEGVTLRVGVQKDGVRSILARSGVLKGVPYKIKYSVFAFGPPLVEAAGANKIDVAGVGSTPPIFGAAAKAQFRVVGTQQFLNEQDDWLLVQGDSGIHKPADLKGKTIGVAKGSSAHGLLLKVLRRAGLKQDDVEISFLLPADALAAFSRKKIDAWPVWEPYVTQGEAEGARSIAGGPPDEHGTNFSIASTSAVNDPARAAALKDYLRRLQKAFAWARKNRGQWAEAWSEESGLPKVVTRNAVPRRLSELRPITKQDIANQQKLADVLAEEKVIPDKITFGDIVTRGLLTRRVAN